MAVLDIEKSVWDEALGEALGGVPDALLLEGTWWRSAATASRLAMLENVRELPFPDMFVGTIDGARVVYCCAYGAARAVEPAHIFAQMGTPLLVQIGTCGAMTSAHGVGVVAVPSTAAARDGVSQYYDPRPVQTFDESWSAQARSILGSMDIDAPDSRHLTWPSLFAQSDAMCAEWIEEGLQTVDMEASAVAAVAARFGRASVALLTSWDVLSEGQTFLDPLSESGQKALNRANAATFKTALELAKRVASSTKNNGN